MSAELETALLEWAKRVPLNQISAILVFLAGRLLVEGHAHDKDPNERTAAESEQFLTAGQVAERLGVPESWVRSEARLGRLPSRKLGKYVRFSWS